MAKYIVQVVILGGRAIGKAFVRTLKDEYTASQAAAAASASRRGTQRGNGEDGGRGTQTAAENVRLGISVEEARQILNVKPEATPQQIQSTYETMFNLNDKARGGSLYIQSKIYRAKERLDEELKLSEKQKERLKLDEKQQRRRQDN